MTAYEYNLNMSAEIVASQTAISISKARKLLKAGLYFGLGDLDQIEQIIIERESMGRTSSSHRKAPAKDAAS